MTYYRRTSYQEGGWADDPDEVHQELHRVQNHMASIDQNNVAATTLAIKQVQNATSPEHAGISDISATFPGIPISDPNPLSLTWLDDGWSYFESGPYVKVKKRLTVGSSGQWKVLGVYNDTAMPGLPVFDAPLRMKVQSASEAPWMISACAEVGVEEYLTYEGSPAAPTEFRYAVRFDLKVVSSTGGQTVASSSVNMQDIAGVAAGRVHNPAGTALLTGSLILPAGESAFTPMYRATWFRPAGSTEPDILLNKVSMFAVGLYK